jgi:hypothetical protein
MYSQRLETAFPPAARQSMTRSAHQPLSHRLGTGDHLYPPIRYPFNTPHHNNNGFWKRKVLTKSLILGIKVLVEIVIFPS